MPKMKLVPNGDITGALGGFLTDFTIYKYYEGQSYFVDDGRVIVDRNSKRQQIGQVATIYGEIDSADPQYDKFKGSLVIQDIADV